MRRLLLVTHRPLEGAGGGGARWRSLARHLPEHGWSVDVLAAGAEASREYSERPADRRRLRRRAAAMAALRTATGPVFAAAGVRPTAAPPSLLWGLREAARLRGVLEEGSYDAVVATSPPVAALLAARRALPAEAPPLVAELRDLWAGNPAYVRRDRALDRVERWLLARAAVTVTTSGEAAAELRRRHAALGLPVEVITNGFEPELLALREDVPRPSDGPLILVHSGTLVPGRPLGPLLRVLMRPDFAQRFRLVLHGYLSRSSLRELREHPGAPVRALPPSSWEDAVEVMCRAHACVVLQGAAVGDATAIAAKTYEYLALGKPVLALTDGGATERLLRTLGADQLCARLADDASVAAALERLAEGAPAPVPAERLRPLSRPAQAETMAALLSRLAG